jgi:hypothetical protein
MNEKLVNTLIRKCDSLQPFSAPPVPLYLKYSHKFTKFQQLQSIIIIHADVHSITSVAIMEPAFPTNSNAMVSNSARMDLTKVNVEEKLVVASKVIKLITCFNCDCF